MGNVKWWYGQMGTRNLHSDVQAAAYAWNISPTPVWMNEVSNKGDSMLRVYSKSYGNTGWYGETLPYFIFTNNNLNEYYSLSDNQFTEVESHEMGHAHGLLEVSCTSELMNASCFIGTPNPYIGDIAGIQYKYTH